MVAFMSHRDAESNVPTSRHLVSGLLPILNEG